MRLDISHARVINAFSAKHFDAFIDQCLLLMVQTG